MYANCTAYFCKNLKLLEIDINHTVQAMRKVKNSNARVLCIFNESYAQYLEVNFSIFALYTWLISRSYPPKNVLKELPTLEWLDISIIFYYITASGMTLINAMKNALGDIMDPVSLQAMEVSAVMAQAGASKVIIF